MNKTDRLENHKEGQYGWNRGKGGEEGGGKGQRPKISGNSKGLFLGCLYRICLFLKN